MRDALRIAPGKDALDLLISRSNRREICKRAADRAVELLGSLTGRWLIEAGKQRVEARAETRDALRLGQVGGAVVELHERARQRMVGRRRLSRATWRDSGQEDDEQGQSTHSCVLS